MTARATDVPGRVERPSTDGRRSTSRRRHRVILEDVAEPHADSRDGVRCPIATHEDDRRLRTDADVAMSDDVHPGADAPGRIGERLRAGGARRGLLHSRAVEARDGGTAVDRRAIQTECEADVRVSSVPSARRSHRADVRIDSVRAGAAREPRAACLGRHPAGDAPARSPGEVPPVSEDVEAAAMEPPSSVPPPARSNWAGVCALAGPAASPLTSAADATRRPRRLVIRASALETAEDMPIQGWEFFRKDRGIIRGSGDDTSLNFVGLAEDARVRGRVPWHRPCSVL